MKNLFAEQLGPEFAPKDEETKGETDSDFKTDSSYETSSD